MSRDVNFACRIPPAVQIDIGEQQWATGFHNELSLCVNCCRMVDVYQDGGLSLSRPILSDCQSQIVMILASGPEHYPGKTQYIPGKQVLVRS